MKSMYHETQCVWEEWFWSGIRPAVCSFISTPRTHRLVLWLLNHFLLVSDAVRCWLSSSSCFPAYSVVLHSVKRYKMMNNNSCSSQRICVSKSDVFFHKPASTFRSLILRRIVLYMKIRFNILYVIFSTEQFSQCSEGSVIKFIQGPRLAVLLWVGADLTQYATNPDQYQWSCKWLKMFLYLFFYGLPWTQRSRHGRLINIHIWYGEKLQYLRARQHSRVSV